MVSSDRICMPGANNPRIDLPRVEIGQILAGYLIGDRRWVRDGTFGAGHFEFYVIKMQPLTNRNNESWIREKTIQEWFSEQAQPNRA